MSDWRREHPENMIHVHEREEARCARQAAEDAGELVDDRPTKQELDVDEFWDNWDGTFEDDDE
jgi:hypothetical protein